MKQQLTLEGRRNIALWCTDMHLYGFVRAYTGVYKIAWTWNLMVSEHAR